MANFIHESFLRRAYTPPEILAGPLREIATATHMSICERRPSSLDDMEDNCIMTVPVSPEDFELTADEAGGVHLAVRGADARTVRSGVTNYVVLHDSASVKHVTTCGPLPIESEGANVTIPGWSIEIGAPETERSRTSAHLRMLAAIALAVALGAAVAFAVMTLLAP